MFAVFVIPVSVISYTPVFYFGALMIWIGWEIAKVRKAWLLLECGRLTC